MKLTEKEEYILKHTFVDYRPTSEFFNYPVIMEKADGLYYWDRDGKKYFDAIGGIFVASLGHKYPEVIEAVIKQLQTMTFAPPLHSIADVTLEFIEKLGEVTPGNLNYIKSYSGGSESIESSLKFVRQYFKQTGSPGKYKFLSCYMGYHGSTFGAMAASGTGKRKTAFEPQMSGFIKVFSPMYFRKHYSSWDECNRFAANYIEDIILNEDPDTVAGFIVEPIGNTGGIVTPTDEYFKIIRAICSKYNIMLVFDEIITGFGKTGSMFAAQTFDVTPDIICSGKGLSSGTVPIGAMMAMDNMADAFVGDSMADNFFAHGNTFAGNPLSCAAGIAVLDVIVKKKLTEKAYSMGQYLRQQLELLKKYNVIREVRGKGTLLGVELVKDTRTCEPFPELGEALKYTALENGLIMRINPTWFAVSPALISEKEDIDIMVDLIDKSLQSALNMVLR